MLGAIQVDGDIKVRCVAAPGGSLVEEAEVQRASACIFAAPSDYKTLRAYYEVTTLLMAQLFSPSSVSVQFHEAYLSYAITWCLCLQN